MHPRPVILLHGLGRSAASMWLLGRRLRRTGFHATALDYPSTRLGLAENCDYVRNKLLQMQSQSGFDLVGHSMGGVIARHLCLEERSLNIEHVVQIGSPNLGSALADRMGPLWAIRKACGPSINDLRQHDANLPVDPRIAAIAGTGGCHSRYSVMKGPHDGAVTVRSAWAGASRRYRCTTMHTLMPLSLEVARHTIATLVASGPAQDLTPQPKRGMSGA